MIDPHVHLRDWGQKAKETLRHGLSVAWRAGLDGVFEMPNTDPPLTTREAILRRIDGADAALASLRIPLFHGLYGGLTAEPRQIEEMVRAWRDLSPRVVGLKMYAGHSTGGMGIVERDVQAVVYRALVELGYTGVLAVHCEKQSLLRPTEWAPGRPASHARVRPPAAEVASVDDQRELALAAGFRRHPARLPYIDPVGAGRPSREALSRPRRRSAASKAAGHQRSHAAPRSAGRGHDGGR